MDENHPKNIDLRPKRRRDKDNPYKIYTVGIHTDHFHYYISFTDNMGVYHELEIEKALFEILDRFELDDLPFLNEVGNHYEHFELTETSLNSRAFEPNESVAEIAIQHIQSERLPKAIATLPEKQRNRLILYYYGGMIYEQIAEQEGCKHPAIIKSVFAAIEKLNKILTE